MSLIRRMLGLGVALIIEDVTMPFFSSLPYRLEPLTFLQAVQMDAFVCEEGGGHSQKKRWERSAGSMTLGQINFRTILL